MPHYAPGDSRPGFWGAWTPQQMNRGRILGGPDDGHEGFPQFSAWKGSKEQTEVHYVTTNTGHTDLWAINERLRRERTYKESENTAIRIIEEGWQHIVYRFSHWDKPHPWNRKVAVYEYVGTFDLEAVKGVYRWMMTSQYA